MSYLTDSSCTWRTILDPRPLDHLAKAIIDAIHSMRPGKVFALKLLLAELVVRLKTVHAGCHDPCFCVVSLVP